MVGGLIATGFGGFPAFGACGDGTGATSFGEPVRDARPNPDGSSIEFNCGSLAVRAVDGSDWSVSGTGPDGGRPDHRRRLRTRSQIKPRATTTSAGFIDASSTWEVGVPRTPLVDLGITLNAGDGTVDMTGAHLDALNTTLNAGSLTLDLAGASGARHPSIGTVNAGSATFDLPGDRHRCEPDAQRRLRDRLPAGRHPAPGRAGAGRSARTTSIRLGLDKVDDEHWMTTGLNAADRSAPRA